MTQPTVAELCDELTQHLDRAQAVLDRLRDACRDAGHPAVVGTTAGVAPVASDDPPPAREAGAPDDDTTADPPGPHGPGGHVPTVSDADTALARHVRLWHLPYPDYLERHEEICAGAPDGGAGPQLGHAGALAHDAELAGLIGDGRPDLVTAVSAMMAVAEHFPCLGYVRLSVALQDPFVTELDPPAHREDVRRQLVALADPGKAGRRVELWRILDSSLRLVVPVERGDDGEPRLVPPAPDSIWCRLLDLCLGEARRFGGTLDPVVHFGHLPQGQSVRQAKEEGLINEASCRSQRRRGAGTGRVVLWPLNAWYGSMRDGSVVADERAEVVWEE
ncbi:hypothetical protein [Micromonospora wenchangensis]|uniref:hypothetical protein n=1 Tax=Micromonospora wenchangensis TaxID=1185415 RepID=UPI003D75369E